MNIWVEFFKRKDNRNNTHAQMKERVHWIDPEESEIMRRYFDNRVDASNFANRMYDQGYHAIVRTDGI